MSNMAESVQFAGAFPVSQNEMDDWSASTVPEPVASDRTIMIE